MAGVQARHRALAALHAPELAFELRGQRLQQRLQARTDARVGPDELFAELGQRRPPAAPAHQQGLPEQRFGLLQQAPGVAVRQADLTPGLRDAARSLHRRQQMEQDVGVERGRAVAIVLANAPVGLQGDAQHVGGCDFMK